MGGDKVLAPSKRCLIRFVPGFIARVQLLPFGENPPKYHEFLFVRFCVAGGGIPVCATPEPALLYTTLLRKAFGPGR
jgi:hypothetical protein